MKIWDHASGAPWAMTEVALTTLLSIAARHEQMPEALLTRAGQPLKNTAVTQIRDGVAIIPIVGPLFRYANLFTDICGATSYDILAKDIQIALDDKSVRGIVFDIDSPGGEVNGCAELARLIFDARGKKPLLAYASGDAASGAYWVASACDKLFVSDTSALGSIGVVAVYRGKGVNESETTEIVSSQSPFKRLDPQSDEGRLRLQTRIDALGQVFVEAVARHRNIGPPDVLKNFGGGDVFIGQHAVDQGLADALGTLERTISSIQSNPALKQGSSFLRTQETRMDLKALQEEHPQLAASLISTGVEQGRLQERERIGAIIACEAASGRESLAQHLAFKTDMNAAMAVAALSVTPVVKTTAAANDDSSGFARVMATIKNPQIDASDEEKAQDDADTIARRIASYSAGARQ